MNKIIELVKKYDKNVIKCVEFDKYYAFFHSFLDLGAPIWLYYKDNNEIAKIPGDPETLKKYNFFEGGKEIWRENSK